MGGSERIQRESKDWPIEKIIWLVEGRQEGDELAMGFLMYQKLEYVKQVSALTE